MTKTELLSLSKFIISGLMILLFWVVQQSYAKTNENITSFTKAIYRLDSTLVRMDERYKNHIKESQNSKKSSLNLSLEVEEVKEEVQNNLLKITENTKEIEFLKLKQ